MQPKTTTEVALEGLRPSIEPRASAVELQVGDIESEELGLAPAVRAVLPAKSPRLGNGHAVEGGVTGEIATERVGSPGAGVIGIAPAVEHERSEVVNHGGRHRNTGSSPYLIGAGLTHRAKGPARVELENHLRQHRDRAGLTQGQLAERVGVIRRTVNTFERGHYVPSTVLALRLAKALGSSVEDLFTLPT